MFLKFVFLGASAVLFLSIPLTLAYAQNQALVPVAVGMAMGGIVLLLALDRQRATTTLIPRNDRPGARLQTLLKDAEQPHFKLSVRSARPWLLCGASIACGTLLLLLGGLALKLVIAAFGVALLACGLAMLPLVLAQRHGPTLTLSRGGVFTPLSGLIPWQSVGGVHLYERRYRGELHGHALTFDVLDLPRYAPQFHPAFRRLYRLRGADRPTLTVALSEASEEPEIICEIARKLWAVSTAG